MKRTYKKTITAIAGVRIAIWQSSQGLDRVGSRIFCKTDWLEARIIQVKMNRERWEKNKSFEGYIKNYNNES